MAFKFKSLFIKDDEGSVQEKDVPVAKSTGRKPSSITGQIVGEINKAFVTGTGKDYGKHLDEVMGAADQPGPDFLEFFNAIKEFNKKALPEQQKYEFAFIPLEQQGVTVPKLLASAEVYKNALNKEAQEFEAEVNEARNNVNTSKLQVDKLTTENTELSKKIEDNKVKISNLNQDIFNSNNSLEAEKQSFDLYLKDKLDAIEAHTINIQKYLSNGNSTK